MFKSNPCQQNDSVTKGPDSWLKATTCFFTSVLQALAAGYRSAFELTSHGLGFGGSLGGTHW